LYQTDWIWSATGWLLAILAAALIFWSLLSDRARGRRRCPKCWYDMSGVPSQQRASREVFQCPECGRITKNPRRLLATRRKWRPAFLALILFLLSYGAFHTPEYRRGGWVRLVPSTYLAAAAPTDFVQPPQFTLTRNSTIIPGRNLLVPGPPRTLSSKELLAAEAWRRVHAGSMWRWQASWYVGRAVEPARSSWERGISVPPKWAKGVPVPAQVSSLVASQWELAMGNADCRAPDGPAYDRFIPLPATGRAGEKAQLRISFVTAHGEVYATTFNSPCVLVQSPLDLMRADNSHAANQAAQLFLDPRLCIIPRGPVTIAIDERSNSRRWKGVTLGLGCRVDVLLSGEVVASAGYAPDWSHELFKNWNELPIQWPRGVADRIRAHPELVRLRVTGDPRESLAALGRWPLGVKDPVCWTGSFEIPAPLVSRPEKFEDPAPHDKFFLDDNR
jgi:hypothetical protein